MSGRPCIFIFTYSLCESEVGIEISFCPGQVKLCRLLTNLVGRRYIRFRAIFCEEAGSARARCFLGSSQAVRLTHGQPGSRPLLRLLF